jgi:hypothetical protein
MRGTVPLDRRRQRGPAKSDVGEHQIERARYMIEIEGLDEPSSVVDLAAAARAHETSELLVCRAPMLRWLLLKDSKRTKVSVRLEDLPDHGGAETSNQLILQICVADEEPKRFHTVAIEVGAKTGPLQTAPEIVLLASVAQTRQSDAETKRAEQRNKLSNRPRPSHRHDGNAFSTEIATVPRGERFNGGLIAGSFDEYDGTQVRARLDRQHPGSVHLVHLHILTARTRRSLAITLSGYCDKR